MAIEDWIHGDWFTPLLSCEWLFKASIFTYGFIILVGCQSCTSYTRAYMVPNWMLEDSGRGLPNSEEIDFNIDF